MLRLCTTINSFVKKRMTVEICRRTQTPMRSRCSTNSFVTIHWTTLPYARGLSTKPARDASTMQGITVGQKKGGSGGYCYGCGADLVKGQSGSMGTVEKSPKYWATKREIVKKAKLKNWALCVRCRKLLKAEEKGNIEKEIEALAPDNKMTEIFRQEVSKIRKVQNAVIILCVDAININGTLLSTIRNYVGGNPILLAVTRCDLLPDYIWEDKDVESIKELLRQRAGDIKPAQIYLCSESKSVMRQIGGIKELIRDLWNNHNGRDLYVVGCANIGKSTLTDMLISGFIGLGDRRGDFKDRLAKRRLAKLQEARSTKSALPGTTLSNVRVPCFADHEQALWDTPGLLVDDSLHQFPIRNFKVIRARRPETIKPDVYVEKERKAFALIVTEKGDDLPLLRIEILQKKSAEGEGPVRIVWNSTLPLSAKICGIKDAHIDEKRRKNEIRDKLEASKDRVEQVEETKLGVDAVQTPKLSPDERKARKEKRRKEYLKKIEAEKAEMGAAEWHRREKERQAMETDKRRMSTLAELTEIHSTVVERGMGMDLAIANFGSLGILMPRTAMIKTFAPKTGVRVTIHDTLGLPPSWGAYKTQPRPTESVADNKEDLDDLDESWESDDKEILMHEDMHDGFVDEWDSDEDNEEFYDEDDQEFYSHSRDTNYTSYKNKRQSWVQKDDIWAQFQGEKVGWQFDADSRWTKGELQEGWNPLRESIKVKGSN